MVKNDRQRPQFGQETNSIKFQRFKINFFLLNLQILQLEIHIKNHKNFKFILALRKDIITRRTQ